MSIKVAFQIDNLDSLRVKTDTSLMLMNEALLRGFEVYFYEVRDLTLRKNELFANVTKLDHLDLSQKDFYKISHIEFMDLAKMDVIFLRQDPPFDMNYITSTYFLDFVKDKVLVVNNPFEVRNHPEKISVLNFPDFIPPTILTQDKNQIEEFIKEHSKVVLKPLYYFGGKDVFLVSGENNNKDAIIDIMLNKYEHPIIVQKFIPEIEEGDKRVLLIGDKIAAYFRRIPKDNSIRANAALGGTMVETYLTDRELEISEKVAKYLYSKNIVLAGIDIAGGYLLEINITSPTGLIYANNLYNVKLEKKVWDLVIEQIEKKVILY